MGKRTRAPKRVRLSFELLVILDELITLSEFQHLDPKHWNNNIYFIILWQAQKLILEININLVGARSTNDSCNYDLEYFNK